jgi:hypothetical protein
MGRVRVELYCFLLIFRFHDNNNHLRKAVTIMVVLVWAVLEISIALNLGSVPDSLSWLRLFVGLLLARMWNIELNSFASGITASKPAREDDDAE